MDEKVQKVLLDLFQKNLTMPPEEFNPNSIDACIARIQQDIKQILEMQRDIIPRLNALERFKWHLMGAIGVVTVGVNAAWEWIKASHK
jgi:hypothetical protein